MIAKPYEHTTPHPEPHLQAGAEAERQMAHYLNRAFKQDPELHALHGLRLVDRGQPEQDGSPGVCQIDHLIVHRWGMFIIESKSVKEEVRVRGDGSGGDEWSRLHRGSEVGMPSPIRQAMRQAEFLRAALQQHRTEVAAEGAGRAANHHQGREGYGPARLHACADPVGRRDFGFRKDPET